MECSRGYGSPLSKVESRRDGGEILVRGAERLIKGMPSQRARSARGGARETTRKGTNLGAGYGLRWSVSDSRNECMGSQNMTGAGGNGAPSRVGNRMIGL